MHAVYAHAPVFHKFFNKMKNYRKTVTYMVFVLFERERLYTLYDTYNC